MLSPALGSSERWGATANVPLTHLVPRICYCDTPAQASHSLQLVRLPWYNVFALLLSRRCLFHYQQSIFWSRTPQWVNFRGSYPPSALLFGPICISSTPAFSSLQDKGVIPAFLAMPAVELLTTDVYTVYRSLFAAGYSGTHDQRKVCWEACFLATLPLSAFANWWVFFKHGLWCHLFRAWRRACPLMDRRWPWVEPTTQPLMVCGRQSHGCRRHNFQP